MTPAMSARAQASLAADSRVARLATIDAAGFPHLVPVCYAADGGTYYSAIDAKPKRMPPERLHRVRNIRRNPRVALLIDHYEEDWQRLGYVMVQGRAEVLGPGPEQARAARLITAKYPQYAAMPLAREAPVIKITAERVIAWSATP
jgi:PPOX class probable F420-dependent enzyme